MGEDEVSEFLTHSAVAGEVAASTLIRRSMADSSSTRSCSIGRSGKRIAATRARTPGRLPPVLSRDEVRALLS